MEFDPLAIIYEALAFTMLLMAMLISTASMVHHMIPLYRAQSIALAVIIFVSALRLPAGNLLSQVTVFMFTAIPIMLMLGVEPLLVMATVPEDISVAQRIKRLFNRQVRQSARQHAYPIWLAQAPSSRTAFGPIVLDLLLMVLAFIIAYSLVSNRFTANILAISLSLLLLGLSIMRSKGDIIAQVMGLLVMEQGMFLAAIRLMGNLTIILFFVVSLFLYIIITLTILVFLLPDLHRISNSIEIDQQERLKG